MFKRFNDDTLFLNHDAIASVEVLRNGREVTVHMIGGNVHQLRPPEGVTVKDYAMQIIVDMNQAKLQFQHGERLADMSLAGSADMPYQVVQKNEVPK